MNSIESPIPDVIDTPMHDVSKSSSEQVASVSRGGPPPVPPKKDIHQPRGPPPVPPKRDSMKHPASSLSSSLSPRKRKMGELKKQATADNLKALRSLSHANLKQALDHIEQIRQEEQEEPPTKRRKLSSSEKSVSPRTQLMNCKSIKSIPQLPLEQVNNAAHSDTTPQGDSPTPRRRRVLNARRSQKKRSSTRQKRSPRSTFQIPQTPRKKTSPRIRQQATPSGFGCSTPRDHISSMTVQNSPPATTYSPRVPAKRVSHNKQKDSSFGSRSKRMSYIDMASTDAPPATKYTPQFSFSKRSHQKKSAPFGSATRRMSFQDALPVTPASTKYSPRPQPEAVSHQKKSAPFGSDTLRMSFQESTIPIDTPSATKYSPRLQPDTISHQKQHAPFGSDTQRMEFQKDLAETQGPCAYSPFKFQSFIETPCANPLKFSSHQFEYIMKSQSTANTHSYIRPDCYSIFNPSHSQGISMGYASGKSGFLSTSDRFQTSETCPPGPGYYNSNYVDLSCVAKKYVDEENENFFEVCNTSLPLEISFLGSFSLLKL